MRNAIALSLFFLLAPGVEAAEWPAPKAPVVPEADGYVAIPGAAFTPAKGNVYRALFDATAAAKSPEAILPAVNNAGSELNAFAVAGVPKNDVRFVIVFHGAAVDGILDDAHYRAKFGIANPNANALAAMKKYGVKLYVCGQHLAGAHIDPATLSKDVTVASDALIVSMAYQNQGYAVFNY